MNRLYIYTYRYGYKASRLIGRLNWLFKKCYGTISTETLCMIWCTKKLCTYEGCTAGVRIDNVVRVVFCTMMCTIVCARCPVFVYCKVSLWYFRVLFCAFASTWFGTCVRIFVRLTPGVSVYSLYLIVYRILYSYRVLSQCLKAALCAPPRLVALAPTHWFPHI